MFFACFEDELTKLAGAGFISNPSELTHKSTIGRSFDWAGYQRRFNREADQNRLARFNPPKPSRPTKPEMIAAPSPAKKKKKKSGKRGSIKIKSSPTPVKPPVNRMTRYSFAPSETPKYPAGVNWKTTQGKWRRQRQRLQRKVNKNIKSHKLQSAPTTAPSPQPVDNINWANL